MVRSEPGASCCWASRAWASRRSPRPWATRPGARPSSWMSGRSWDRLVGQTEERTRQALKIADAMAPCVLFIDEIEKALSRGPVERADRLRASAPGSSGRFLTWLNDHETDVFVVATANDVSKLPPELTRAERFDGVFFLDLPGRQEKDAIWRMYIEQVRAEPRPAHAQRPGLDRCRDQVGLPPRGSARCALGRGGSERGADRHDGRGVGGAAAELGLRSVPRGGSSRVFTRETRAALPRPDASVSRDPSSELSRGSSIGAPSAAKDGAFCVSPRLHT